MSILLNKQVNDKIKELVSERAKQVLGVRAPTALRIIEAIDFSKGAIQRLQDVPYLAGSSNDNKTVFIDRRVPEKIKIGEQYLDPAKYLRIHEMTEHALMEKMDIPYTIAHKIAEEYERGVLQADGYSWKKYEETLDGYVDDTEHEKIKSAPKELYLKPYDKVLKNRILRHEQVVNWR